MIPLDFQPSIFDDPTIARKASDLNVCYQIDTPYRSILKVEKINHDNREAFLELIELIYDYYLRNKVQHLSLRRCYDFGANCICYI